jgi:hypothetical protein
VLLGAGVDIAGAGVTVALRLGLQPRCTA